MILLSFECLIYTLDCKMQRKEKERKIPRLQWSLGLCISQSSSETQINKGCVCLYYYIRVQPQVEIQKIHALGSVPRQSSVEFSLACRSLLLESSVQYAYAHTYPICSVFSRQLCYKLLILLIGLLNEMGPPIHHPDTSWSGYQPVGKAFHTENQSHKQLEYRIRNQEKSLFVKTGWM